MLGYFKYSFIHQIGDIKMKSRWPNLFDRFSLALWPRLRHLLALVCLLNCAIYSLRGERNKNRAGRFDQRPLCQLYCLFPFPSSFLMFPLPGTCIAVLLFPELAVGPQGNDHPQHDMQQGTSGPLKSCVIYSFHFCPFPLSFSFPWGLHGCLVAPGTGNGKIGLQDNEYLRPMICSKTLLDIYKCCAIYSLHCYRFPLSFPFIFSLFLFLFPFAKIESKGHVYKCESNRLLIIFGADKSCYHNSKFLLWHGLYFWVGR